MKKKSIYLDHAATTKIDKLTLSIMNDYLSDKYNNASQLYTPSYEIKKIIEKSRSTIAKIINADPEEIYFTSGGTESNNWSIIGTTLYNKKNGSINTSPIEHHSILNTCNFLLSYGYPIKYTKVSNKGRIIENDYVDKVANTIFNSISIVNNEIGTIQNITELTKICHENESTFHTDAVQAIGHLKIDVKKLGVDLLSSSAHKFNGPKGIGFLYIKKGTEISPYIFGGKQENNKRGGTENTAYIIGMTEALKNNIKNLKNNSSKLKKLEKIFIENIEDKIDFIENGYTDHLPGLVNISIKNMNGEKIMNLLDLKNIYISTGSACNSGMENISHVIEKIGVPKKYARGTIRISFGKENTEDDAINTAKELVKIVKKQI